MPLAEWDDGYVLDADMRREDPLYYYVTKGQWKDAVGLQLDPLYNEMAAEEVTFFIVPAYLERPNAAIPQARKVLFLRVIPFFLKRLHNCKSFTIRDDSLALMQPELDAVFEQAAFKPKSGGSATERTWEKQHPGWFARLFR